MHTMESHGEACTVEKLLITPCFMTTPYPGQSTWIMGGASTHEGSAADHVTIRNNIAYEIRTASAGTIVVDHNVAIHALVDSTGRVWYVGGSYSENNVMAPSFVSDFVTTFDLTNWNFDVHIKAGSPASNGGPWRPIAVA